MDDSTLFVFEKLGISLLLGMLVGLQRQHVESEVAGVRTFPLVTLLGTLAATIDVEFDSKGWFVAAGLLALAAIVVVAHVRLLHRESAQTGMTTATAILLMYGVGAYLAMGSRLIAIAIGTGVAVLLQFKPELHSAAKRLGNEDMRAIMQFALFSCIVLPVLPNQSFGYFEVLNPFNIWLMVVLIVGINLGGYILYRFFGRNVGAALSGILGGAISSTATTVSYSRRTATRPSTARLAASVIMIASSVVYLRVILEIAAVAPSLVIPLGLPIAIMFGSSLIAACATWLRLRNQPDEMPAHENPTEFASALIFGGLYVIVLVALAAAEHYLGNQGLFAVAAASGMTDMDAITLSTARMVDQRLPSGGIDIATGWRLIVVASMSNIVFKAGIVAVLGHRKLFWRISLLFAVPIVTGVLLLVFWPTG